MSPSPEGAPRPWLLAGAAAGLLAFLAGLFLEPARVWPGYLAAVWLVAGAGLGGALLLSLHFVTGARWSRPLLPVASAMTCAVPLAGGLALLLGLGTSSLYPWADAVLVGGDPVLSGRAAWMTTPLVLARTALAFGTWTALSAWLVRRARDPIAAGGARAGAVFLVLFAPTFSLLVFDLLMSLERSWFSTIWAVYQFSGLLLSAIALLAVLAVALRRAGRLRGVDEDVLHDLGRLLFAFSLFWAYIWFCQYMLIWYVNNPEETPFYRSRHYGGWEPLSIANVLANFAIPFLVLLPRAMKRREAVLLRVGALVLAGRWLDVYLSIAPASQPSAPSASPYEYALPAGAACLFLWFLGRTLRRAPPPAAAPPGGRPAPVRAAGAVG